MIEILVCLTIATAVLAVLAGCGLALFYVAERYGFIVYAVTFAIILVIMTTAVIYSARNPSRVAQSQPTAKEQP